MIALPPTRIDFEVLRTTVHRHLCDLGHLEIGCFPMTERIVVRGGKACGVYFCLHGPRSVKLTAICDFRGRSVIYYGTDGTRALQQPIPSAAADDVAAAA